MIHDGMCTAWNIAPDLNPAQRPKINGYIKLRRGNYYGLCAPSSSTLACIDAVLGPGADAGLSNAPEPAVLGPAALGPATAVAEPSSITSFRLAGTWNDAAVVLGIAPA